MQSTVTDPKSRLSDFLPFHCAATGVESLLSIASHPRRVYELRPSVRRSRSVFGFLRNIRSLPFVCDDTRSSLPYLFT